MGKLFWAAVFVICTAVNALAIDTFIYGQHETGYIGNYGPTGFVGKDGISRVILYSIDPSTLGHIAHIYRVTVPEGSDPDTHPDNPAAPGPVAPRTLVEERSFELGVKGGIRSEFYVPGRGDTIYYGPAYGIRKYVFDAARGNYLFKEVVAPAAPKYGGRSTGTLAHDKRSNTWYAGSFSYNSQPGVTTRRVWKYDGNQGPNGQWEVAFDYTSTELKYSYHDGMEMVNGNLYLGDSYGTLIYEYTPEGVLLRTYLRDPVPSRGEGMEYLGMGFRALQHFWYGSNDNTILEFGGGLLDLEEINNPPVAVAGAPVTVTTDQWARTVVEGSVTDPDGGELLCRWLHGDTVLQDWSVVAPDGSCPLFVGRLAPFAVGSYPLTIEGMDDMGATDFDHTTLTVKELSCSVSVDKKCLVQTAPTAPFVCSDAKPIDALTMIWTGQGGIYIKAWKGTPGGTLLAEKGPIATGEKVTVTGMGGSPNDQVWEIFSGIPQATGSNKIGDSYFHISCSDLDMNGPEDCGKLQGNGRTVSTSLINSWRFDGMSGNGESFACTPASSSRQDNCSFVTEPWASCQSLAAKPKTLSFRYSGNDCSASRNSQASDKWFCSGAPGANPTVSIVKDPAKFSMTPAAALQAGDMVTVSAAGSDMESELLLKIGGQSLKIHTSCSQPLAVGDVFGAFELVQFNGHGAGAKVTYSYEVKNSSSLNVDISSLFDDNFGELLQKPATLAAGGVMTVEKSAFISRTTANQVTALARIAGTARVCGQARDQLMVAVTPQTCNMALQHYSLYQNSLKFQVTNTSSTIATLETLTLRFPASYGAIGEIRLDGTIFKYGSGITVVGSGVTLSRWTNSDVTKRQLDPGETRTLEVLFTQIGEPGSWFGMNDLGGVTFKEGCQASFPPFPACQFGKPMAIEFQYTGESCSAGSNQQTADGWSCSGDPAGAGPVDVVMAKDAGLIEVTLKNDADGDGRIDVGDTFVLRRTDGRMFVPQTYLNIVNGGTLQSLSIHTSCSQPLDVGDQFGSVILKSYQPKL